jgi:IS5 family transposase
MHRGTDRVRVCVIQERVHGRGRMRAGRCEQSHGVATGDERVTEQRHHHLDPSIRRRRDRNPRRREHGHAQRPGLALAGAEQP